jgi:outer membrane lipoprotein-sorting protein
VTPDNFTISSFRRLLSRRQVLVSLAATAALAASSPPSGAAPQRTAPRAAPLAAQDQMDVQRVEAYLNGIFTLQSRFQQFSPEGGVATGTIYLERPGRMRIVYDDPVPVLIVADGSRVFYWDRQVAQLSQIDVKDTPAWFLLRPVIRLSGDVTLTRFDHASGALRLTMTETEHPDNGNLTLVMSDHPLQLRQWTVLDAQRKSVTVTLEDPHYGVTFPPNFFVWTDQRSPSQIH